MKATSMKSSIWFITLVLVCLINSCGNSPQITSSSDLSFFPEKIQPLTEFNESTFELGRRLFYDPILSRDSSISCASCHKQEFAFSDAPNKFSTGINGMALERNTPALFNLEWYEALFWDGKAKSLEEQVFHPIEGADEMDLNLEQAVYRLQSSNKYLREFKKAFGDKKINQNRIAIAIAQFERQLISNNAKYDRVLRGEEHFSPDEYAGFVLVNDQSKGDCLHCHPTDAHALATNGGFSNNGLDAFGSPEQYKDKGLYEATGLKNDIGKFKIPSLRNIAITSPYMHDGRFSTLKEVVDFYSEGVNQSFNLDSKMTSAHKGGVSLTEKEKEEIIAFLRTLTDSIFIANPAFGNPN